MEDHFDSCSHWFQRNLEQVECSQDFLHDYVSCTIFSSHLFFDCLWSGANLDRNANLIQRTELHLGFFTWGHGRSWIMLELDEPLDFDGFCMILPTCYVYSLTILHHSTCPKRGTEHWNQNHEKLHREVPCRYSDALLVRSNSSEHHLRVCLSLLPIVDPTFSQSLASEGSRRL